MLRLYPPRKGFSQNWRIRGTYLGCRVDQSSGTHRQHVAASILAEIGFLSNPREENNLMRADYRQKLAEALYKGLSRYTQTLSHFELSKK